MAGSRVRNSLILVLIPDPTSILLPLPLLLIASAVVLAYRAGFCLFDDLECRRGLEGLDV